jgi:predicted transposase/invertase (TIGR01784 family)
LIEFQSRVDKYMALRMMVYVGLLYQDLIKEGHVKGLLPPILPIVLYNGNRTWTAKTDIADLIPVLPPFLASFTPHLKYHLIAENAYSDTELASLKNLVAAVFRFEQFSEPTTIIELIGLLNDWLEDRPDLKRVFAIWIRATLKRKKNYAIVLPEVDDLQEIKVMFGDRLELWAEGLKAGAKVEGKQEGRQEGRQEGEMLMLQRLLAKRFGAIPADKISLISNASVDEIEHWADRVFDAKQLSDIFND